MPFLPQPSPFIRAWDRHQETQKCATDGWVLTTNLTTKVVNHQFFHLVSVEFISCGLSTLIVLCLKCRVAECCAKKNLINQSYWLYNDTKSVKSCLFINCIIKIFFHLMYQEKYILTQFDYNFAIFSNGLLD